MPRIQTTPMVKASLYALRIYLIVLLALILVKFVRMLSASSSSHAGFKQEEQQKAH